MSNSDHPAKQWRPQPPHGEFVIKKVYIKDVSFETPNSPRIFRSEWTPQTDVHLHSHSSDIAPGEYEVVLMVTASVSVDGKTAFLAETQVAGVFGITGLTQDELGPTLGSYCPSILFPYARELISSLSVRGGFPQFILAPVNFEALYRRHISTQFSEQQAQVER
ncbi:MAG: protein-export chaperone SecB [Gammaproteobacteria bacterium]|nr:protein-export chaperone SecB [Gammaproteobacteria bacterium]